MASAARRLEPPRQVHACVASPAAEPTAAPHIPHSIADISNGNILGFGADLAEDHPGFHDAAYKRRRMRIAEAAKEHSMCACPMC